MKINKGETISDLIKDTSESNGEKFDIYVGSRGYVTFSNNVATLFLSGSGPKKRKFKNLGKALNALINNPIK